ncbi:Condensin-2 complex subunit G2, partial [Perkinsus olseni]
IPVWKTVADLLHELGFTGNMSTSLVMNTLQLTLSHVSTLHPQEGEEALIDKMAKVAASKYGYDAQFKEFLRKRVICECDDDEEDEEGYAAEEDACHERVWQAFKRVALGPPVNKALAELLNIEVEELQPQGNNKENNPDQVGASEGNGSITPKAGRMHEGGSSSSSALPGEVIIQSGAPTPVHREDVTLISGRYLFSGLSVVTTTKVMTNKPGGREQELELASTTGGWQVADIVHDMLGQVSRQDAFSAALKAHRYGESSLTTAPQRSVAERWVKMLTDRKITASARPLFPDGR